MRLSGEDSLQPESSEGNAVRSPRSKIKHKRLDLICEKVYVRNHRRKKSNGVSVGGDVRDHDETIEKAGEVTENGVSVGGDESEPRRSSRVRRAPEILDASPVPSRKRRKVDAKEEVNGVDRGKRELPVKGKNALSPPTELDEEESLSGWKARLRSKGENVRSGGRGGMESPSANGRRKLFIYNHEMGEGASNGVQESDSEEEVGERPSTRKAKIQEAAVGLGVWGTHKEGVFVGSRSAARSKRTKRVTFSHCLENEKKETVSGDGIENGKEVNKERSSDEGNGLDLNGGISEMVGREKTEILGGFRSDHSNDDTEMQLNEITSDPAEPQNDGVADDGATEDLRGREHHVISVEIDGATENMPNFREQHVGTLEVENTPKDKSKVPSTVGELQDKLKEAISIGKSNEGKKTVENAERPIRIKEGRRCGLCGGGIDGKPPKKLVHGAYGSDDDICSGSSASEEPNYDALDGFTNEPGWLGRLLGPVNDRFGIANIWVHQQCAVWSPEVYFAGLGCLKNVKAALYRGRVLKCSRCGKPGATIGCRVDRCPKTYHLPCARDSGAIFDHRKFLIACTDHRHIFQPQGSLYVHRIKKLKLRKLKFEVRKVSNDASRKDIEAEEKWLEHCGEDEEFLKRESKRLHRDLLRIAPTYIGGSGPNTEMQFQGWDSVAGLQNVIQCMKEVVILPLLYPEFFSNLGITPPRGVLLHGYPGTGKTLVVRALIGSCARGDRRIAYFARKGADCLGKYVGDAERQLRLLFQVAEKSQPSIIFFDEIDGLAPSRSRNQDQTHSSVVSTLLALMDGLKSRGSVVVIGATNRPDSIDPALRRPGRFDREIYFPLPSVKDREAILSLHTQKWPKQISGPLLKWVARRTVGFAGADLQALCTQAAIVALRRNFPLKELLASAGENALLGKRPPLPSFNVEERDWLDALSLAPPPCSHREAGVAANVVISLPLPGHLVPCLLQPLSKLIVSLHLDERVWLPSALLKAATLIKNVIVSGLVGKKVLGDKWWSHVHDLLQKADVLKEIEDKLSRTTILADSFDSYDSSEDVAEDSCLSFKPSTMQRVGAHPGLSHSISSEPNIKSGFRILISGEARSGQRHLSSCLLHCFSGNIEIRKLDLATFFQEGHGDVVQGLTSIMMRCASVGSCMLFLPRIDLWAVETFSQSSEEDTSSSSVRTTTEESAENPESQNEVKMVTYLWNSFFEQVESICVRTPPMILATSEVPIENLPSGVKNFFSCEMLDCGLVNPYKDTVPRFVMEIDGNLNPVTAADASVGRLLADLVQYFIHLLRLGIHANSRDKLSCNYEPVTVDPINSNSDPGSIAQDVDKHLTAPVTPNNPVKGSSSLLAAIATFGYQILKCPNFAELCFVTSKLKEGPCSRINGAGKGWPFNKCIARPVNSKEEVVVASTSNAAKNRDKPCVVRGLIAVGLSAYRGEYTSLRVFSSEIRKVLELLVGCVDTKIQAGKNKYKFYRLLSQVAYFEDMVISWAFSLQSLEVDAPYSEGSPRLNDGDKESIHGNANHSNKCLNESEVLEPIPQEAIADDADDHREEVDNSAQVSTIPNPLPNEISSDDHLETDLEGGKHSNGFLQKNSSASDDEQQGSKLSDGVPVENGSENSSCSSRKVSSGSNVPPLSCMYHCCPHCLTNLHQALLKLINDEWKLKGSSETVEDFHDIVASVSISLQSEVRKLFAKDSLEKHENSGRVIEPKECSCHSAEEKLLQNSRFDPNLKLCFRDGVLVAALDGGGGREDPLHCNFERLSLSSLVDCIAATRKE